MIESRVALKRFELELLDVLYNCSNFEANILLENLSKNFP